MMLRSNLVRKSLVALAIAVSGLLALTPSAIPAHADGTWEGPYAPNAIPEDVCSPSDHPDGLHRAVSHKSYLDGRIINVDRGRGEITDDASGSVVGKWTLLQTSIRSKGSLPWVLETNVTISCKGQGVVLNQKAGIVFDANGNSHEHAIPGSPLPS